MKCPDCKGTGRFDCSNEGQTDPCITCKGTKEYVFKPHPCERLEGAIYNYWIRAKSNKSSNLFLYDGEYDVYYEFKINFCPFCGEKLPDHEG